MMLTITQIVPLILISTVKIHAKNRINGILVQQWQHQSQFDNNIDGLAKDVKNAIDWGFNRVYIGGYNYLQPNKFTDQMIVWNSLSSATRKSVQNYAASKNAKLIMLATGYTPNIIQESVTDYSAALVTTAKQLNFDGVMFDMHSRPIAGYPVTQQKQAYLDFHRNLTTAVCQTFPKGVSHFVTNLDLGSWNFAYGTAQQTKSYPTSYGKLVDEVVSCLDAVVLDYYVTAAPDTQTDEQTLYKNSSTLTLVNNMWDYRQTALAEIIANQPGTSKNVFVVGKPLSNYGKVKPNDLKCWSNGTDLAGFVTWPFQSVAAKKWASEISHCGDAPTISTPPKTPSSSVKLQYPNILLSVLALLAVTFPL